MGNDDGWEAPGAWRCRSCGEAQHNVRVALKVYSPSAFEHEYLCRDCSTTIFSAAGLWLTHFERAAPGRPPAGGDARVVVDALGVAWTQLELPL